MATSQSPDTRPTDLETPGDAQARNDVQAFDDDDQVEREVLQ
jgi:hypothetical protein